jgi:hypothetical protein
MSVPRLVCAQISAIPSVIQISSLPNSRTKTSDTKVNHQFSTTDSEHPNIEMSCPTAHLAPDQSCCASHFLASLVPIKNFNSVLKEDRECCICLQTYGNTTTDGIQPEFPIRLPFCNHLVGFKCLKKWLSPDISTCPICRRAFSPAPEQEDGVLYDSNGFLAVVDAGDGDDMDWEGDEIEDDCESEADDEGATFYGARRDADFESESESDSDADNETEDDSDDD